MYYEESVIEEVRSRNDVVSVIGSYIHLQKRGGNYVGLCPFHNEKTPSFSVNTARQTYKCFGCGKGGNVFTFIMEYENFNFVESLKFLADRGGVTLPQQEYGEESRLAADNRKNLQEVYRQAATYYYRLLNQPVGKNGLDYLLNRKLSEDTIVKFGLGFSDGNLYKVMKEQGYKDEFLSKSGLFTYTEQYGVKDKFWNRVMFPIMDANSKVIAFGGRVMGDALPKYLNSPETPIFEKGKNLYGLHVARRTRKNYMLLCEGYMDTIALHQAGFDNAVASLGTALTGMQANLLHRYTKEVVLTYDSDGAGQKACLRAIPILKDAGIKARVLNMKPYKDPDEFIKALGAEEYEKRIQSAVGSFFFELSVMAEQHDLHDPDDRTAFQIEVAKRMLDYPDELERNNYMEAFCREYYVSIDDFRKKVNKLGSDAQFQKSYDENKEKDKREYEQRRKPDAAIQAAQKLVLTWCIENPDCFRLLEGVLTSADFEEGVYRTVSEICFRQFEEAGRVEPARLISRFETKEEQTLAAEICQTELLVPMQAEERRKAFADTVLKIKQKSLEEANTKAVRENDAAKLLELMKAKKDLKTLHQRLMKH